MCVYHDIGYISGECCDIYSNTQYILVMVNSTFYYSQL